MTQKPKKPSKSKDAETIIDSDQGKLTYLTREIIAWRDKGLLDDPYNLIEDPIEGQRPLLDILSEHLNWLQRINDAQRDRSFLKSNEKPYGGYFKVKRGHRWQTRSYEGATEIRDKLSDSQFKILLRLLSRAEELRLADTDPAQLKPPPPTQHSRYYADLTTYRKYGLPTGSRRYAIHKGANKNEAASWIGDRSEEWLVLGLPDPNRRVVNVLASFMTPDPATPEDIEIYEAHQLPQFFGFSIDSDVSAAADIHEAALSVERLEGLLPADSFRTLVGAAMHLQLKLTTLCDMIGKADPNDPKSLTISETVEAGLVAVRTWGENGKATGGENKKEKEEKKKVVLAILTTEMATQKLTKTEAIDAVRREWPSRWKHKPRKLGHNMAEKYIDELRRSGLIPEWK